MGTSWSSHGLCHAKWQIPMSSRCGARNINHVEMMIGAGSIAESQQQHLQVLHSLRNFQNGICQLLLGIGIGIHIGRYLKFQVSVLALWATGGISARLVHTLRPTSANICNSHCTATETHGLLDVQSFNQCT